MKRETEPVCKECEHKSDQEGQREMYFGKRVEIADQQREELVSKLKTLDIMELIE